MIQQFKQNHYLYFNELEFELFSKFPDKLSNKNCKKLKSERTIEPTML